MRTIKFRGKRVPDHLKKKNDGTWVYGYLYKSADGRMCIDEWYVDPETVGQYTGLADKNGRELYEGDVINRYGGGILGNPAKVLATGEVRYHAPSFHIACGPDEWANMYNASELEIIGNSIENPELLST